jgi:Uma2 family endonuclease
MAQWGARRDQVMPISEQTFKQVALEDPEGHWELHCGQLRQKPGMTARHNEVTTQLLLQLGTQLRRHDFRLRSNAGHVQRTTASYYLPDVFVVPANLVQAQIESLDLEVYDSPLPLVVEIWSPSTGGYDLRTKLREYQLRGDLEIWLIHPYERTLTAWRRQPDGGYTEASQDHGTVEPISLPGVSIDFDALFR